jgi:hypothetical protein
MLRTASGLGVVVVLLATAGCRMCCHPYDYCGPVYGPGCQSCSPCARAGSILSGAPQVVSSPVPVRREVHQELPGIVQGQIQGKMQLGDVPGSERIVSVTDRVVGSSADSAESAEMASAPADSAMSSPGKGWTARRPTSEILR